jgi:hypothetical protein
MASVVDNILGFFGLAQQVGAGAAEFFNPDVPTSTVAADAYEKLYYGRIPTVTDAANRGIYPVPAAPPASRITDPTYTPEESGRAGLEQYTQRIRQMIADDEASGSYTPNPTLPTASKVDETLHNPWFIAGVAAAAALGLVLVVKVTK